MSKPVMKRQNSPKPPKQDMARMERIIEFIRNRAKQCPAHGYRMIHTDLNRAGLRIGKHKVRGIMQRLGLMVKTVKGPDRDNGPVPGYPNLIEDIEVPMINQVWLADFTYIRTTYDGYIYLAAIMDLCPRKIIGYAISPRPDTELVLEALRMAMSRRCTQGVIHHSDQGSQYTSNLYIEELIKNGFQISLCRKGFPYHNAIMERWMQTLKTEEVNLREYKTINGARYRIKNYIEQVYNKKRPHTSLGKVTPTEYEETLIARDVSIQKKIFRR